MDTRIRSPDIRHPPLGVVAAFRQNRDKRDSATRNLRPLPRPRIAKRHRPHRGHDPSAGCRRWVCPAGVYRCWAESSGCLRAKIVVDERPGIGVGVAQPEAAAIGRLTGDNRVYSLSAIHNFSGEMTLSERIIFIRFQECSKPSATIVRNIPKSAVALCCRRASGVQVHSGAIGWN
jgi:hypothetical protein